MQDIDTLTQWGWRLLSLRLRSFTVQQLLTLRSSHYETSSLPWSSLHLAKDSFVVLA